MKRMKLLDIIENVCKRCPLMGWAERNKLKVHLKCGWMYLPCFLCPLDKVEDLILWMKTRPKRRVEG